MATKKWRPGDLAEVIPNSGRISGELVELRVFVGEYFNHHKNTKVENAWFVDCAGEMWAVEEDCLKEPRDPNEKVEWTDCVFRPVEYITYP